MWDLWVAYETDLKIREPIDPFVVTAKNDVYEEEGTIVVIETANAAFEFQGKTEVRAVRQMPQNFNLALNVNLQLPPNLTQAIQAGQIPPNVAQFLQAMMQQAQQALLQQAQQAVQQAVREQAPIAGLQAAFRGGRWIKVV